MFQTFPKLKNFIFTTEVQVERNLVHMRLVLLLRYFISLFNYNSYN